MAVLYACGFEAGSAAAYTAGVWSVFGSSLDSTVSTQHRSLAGVGGNYSVLLSSGAAATISTGSFLATTARWVHAWYIPRNNFAGYRVGVARTGTGQAHVALLANGSVVIYRHTTTLQTTLAAFNPGLPHWVAVFFDCRESPNGRIEVWIDGVNVATFTGDTRNTASDQWDAIGFGQAPFSGTTVGAQCYVDDVIVTDATTGRLAEHFLPALRPEANGSTIQLTPSAGANWQCVDEAPPSDADNNSATVAGQYDLYALPSVPASTAAISFVSVCARATRDGVIATGEIAVKSGATTAYGTATALATTPTYTGLQYVWDTDPNTAAAWTEGGVNAMEAGFRLS